MDVLKEVRKAAKKTQIQVANMLGVTQAAYAMYENGSRSPTNDMLIKLADYFGVSVDYLLGRPECPTEPIDEDLRHLTDTWHSLSDTAKMRLLAYADGLKDNE